eukprot:GHVS01101581.1.p3 GENE.GHVS01101581.1~~GHVS01101581.1.p3  ORF type:complete len:106 (-),score=4.34 GHVS01101581.1:99-416(-)
MLSTPKSLGGAYLGLLKILKLRQRLGTTSYHQTQDLVCRTFKPPKAKFQATSENGWSSRPKVHGIMYRLTVFGFRPPGAKPSVDEVFKHRWPSRRSASTSWVPAR